MTSFPESVRRGFVREGFKRHGKGVLLEGKDAFVYVHGYVMRRSAGLAYGLWLKALSGDPPPPARHELYHIYGGADHICGINILVKLSAYHATDEDVRRQRSLAEEKIPEFARCLEKLLDIYNVVKIYEQQPNKLGLLRIEVRRFLEERLKEMTE